MKPIALPPAPGYAHSRALGGVMLDMPWQGLVMLSPSRAVLAGYSGGDSRSFLNRLSVHGSPRMW